MSAPQPPPKAPTQRKVAKKGLFAKDLGAMMYGFGDDNPAPDTIALMEELVVEHISDLCQQAHMISTNRGKVKVEDFRFALRRDPKKLARLDELLFMQEEITRARRGFDNTFDEYADEDDIAAAKADVAAGVGIVNGSSGAALAAGAAATKKGPAGTSGGLTLPGGGGGGAAVGGGSGSGAGGDGKAKAAKAKGKQKA
ncbi:hypothetical protein JCM3775_001832 [Rhodotorula graminis]|uniref:Transcription initiation factor TFIID subunit 13 n=1 Tax=Rhodotorula graminis (strain WP1) TaxID=578459 RepID=A0A194S2X3_RHOGW|nr:uncharacterized protein RHOBADRAFT_44456 [Rhodotorula graminis WP1]KPV74937.1 hypothetical protein RHOBADRAFT_44456 [Rhodotorula graminis WP1]